MWYEWFFYTICRTVATIVDVDDAARPTCELIEKKNEKNHIPFRTSTIWINNYLTTASHTDTNTTPEDLNRVYTNIRGKLENSVAVYQIIDLQLCLCIYFQQLFFDVCLKTWGYLHVCSSFDGLANFDIDSFIQSDSMEQIKWQLFLAQYETNENVHITLNIINQLSTKYKQIKWNHKLFSFLQGVSYVNRSHSWTQFKTKLPIQCMS